MFGFSKKERILAREEQRHRDELDAFGGKIVVVKSYMENTFEPKDKYCYMCGSKLNKYTLRTEYCAQTGDKVRICYMGCPTLLPYSIHFPH